MLPVAAGLPLATSRLLALTPSATGRGVSSGPAYSSGAGRDGRPSMLKRLTVAIVLLTFLALVPPSPPAKADEVVGFPDRNLEAAIREAIGKPAGDIYCSELERISMLDMDSRGIANLSGLHCCTNLAVLSLWNNQITDLSPLSGLTSLAFLYLGRNPISDISPLSKLTNLKGVNLGSDFVSDVSPLVTLTSLTHLWLAHNNISDISPLLANTGLDAGDTLDLAYNPLNSDAVNIYIPQLEQRGVSVRWGSPPIATPMATGTPAATGGPTPAPTPAPAPTSTSSPIPVSEPPPFNVWIVVGAVLGVLAVGSLVYYAVLLSRVARRRGGTREGAGRRGRSEGPRK